MQELASDLVSEGGVLITATQAVYYHTERYATSCTCSDLPLHRITITLHMYIGVSHHNAREKKSIMYLTVTRAYLI